MKLSLNPSASSFVPSGAAKPAAAATPAPAAAPAPAAVAAAPVVTAAPVATAAPAPAAAVPAAQPAAPKAAAEEPALEEISDPELLQELQAIAKEEAAVAGGGAVEAALVDPGKPHINVVFIGHVDHGKSTMSGAILLACGMVNARDVEKLQKDAEAAGRDSWWKAFLLDTNPEERAKGKTQETARSHFQTANKMYTILDAPGHKAFVPSMISGAAQADVAVLVISARTGEFEDGFVKGGQTKEHTMLVRTLGVSHIVVAVNKMDDKTVEWSQSRFDSIQRELNDFLRKAGFKKEQVSFVPLSALTGSGLLERVDPAVCPWYKGEGGAPLSLLETLDAVSRSRDEDPTLPLRIPLLDRYKEAGKVFAMGKVDGGRVKVGDVLVAHPGGHECTVGGLESEFGPLKEARPGDNVTLWLKGIDDNLFHTGYVLCKKGQRQCPVVKRFQAQILVNALPESRPIITSGYQCVMHVHTCTVEVTIDKIVNVLDKKTGKPIKGQAFVRKGSAATVVIECALPVALEKFEDFNSLARILLRDEDLTVAVGKVLKIAKE